MEHLAIDIADIQNVEQAEFEIVHPQTRKGLGLFFMLLGPTHPIRKNGSNDIQENVMKRLTGRAANDGDDDQETKNTQWLVNCTTGWRQETRDANGDLVPELTGPYIMFAGNRLIHSPTVVRTLYEDRKYFWLREQVDVYLGKQKDFIVDSSATSAAGSSGVTV